jgi:thymidylate synthase
MRQYLDLLEDVLKHGTRQSNRTGIDAISLPGAMLKFDLGEGFPAVTTKKLAFKSVAAELVGFLRGYDNAADFRALGSRIWDQNANENPQWLNNPHRKGHDDLGRVYGVQWRNWRGANGTHVDQVMQALKTIRERPTDRRIIISAWKPDELDEMALPPCHISYQFLVNVERGELHLCMYQRSCDLFLGVPFNIASCALFLSLMARLTGYKPGQFTHFLADAHIYVNHLEQVEEQLSRAPHPLPQLEIDARVPAFDGNHFQPEWIGKVEPDDFRLKNYVFDPALRAPMAV